MRRTALKPSSGTRWPTAVREHIASHQPPCVGPLLGMPGYCSGGGEIDHVRTGGTGLKSKSVATNGIRACSWHHRVKTEHGKEWRPKFLQLIARLHGECAACQRESITEWGVPLEGVSA